LTLTLQDDEKQIKDLQIRLHNVEVVTGKVLDQIEARKTPAAQPSPANPNVVEIPQP
jgi:hypothetical protein